MSTMRGGDHVRRAQGRTRAGGNRLLADRRVNEAVNVAVAQVLADAQFERPNSRHHAEASQEDVLICDGAEPVRPGAAWSRAGWVVHPSNYTDYPVYQKELARTPVVRSTVE